MDVRAIQPDARVRSRVVTAAAFWLRRFYASRFSARAEARGSPSASIRCVWLVVAILIARGALAIDTDNDGVDDAADLCCRTPAGLIVDADGRPVGDLERDCDVDLDDFAIFPVDSFLDEFSLFQRNFSGPLTFDGPCIPVCDGQVSGIAQPASLSANSPPSNDRCRDATCIGLGTGTFSNQGARTDGPTVPPPCDGDGDAQIGSDIWFCHPAYCTDTVVVSACGSDFDTKLAVYEGCGCPTGTLLTCNDDGCRPELGVPSRVSFPAVRGQEYLIRIGGFSGIQGSGLLTIYCASDPTRGVAACGEGAGDCFASNGSPACNGPACCEDVCALDNYCCDVEWDDRCAADTDGVCTGFAVCDTANGGCSVARQQPGCSDSACCNAVCQIDELCCLDAWDEACVTLAEENCTP